MRGKTILITGATSGIGKQTAITLATMGAIVIVTGRNRENAELAVQEIQQISQNQSVGYLLADLSTVAGVQKLASDFQQQYPRLDVLINNAGSATDRFQKTVDGFEMNFMVNVIGPFLLSSLLLEQLKKAENGRIITLAGGDLPNKIDLQNLQSEKGFYGLNTYSQTKMAMMCLMYEYARRLKGTGVTCNICYPGQASTSMTQNVTADMLPWLARPLFPVFKLLTKPDGGKSAQKASRSSVFLASSPEVEGKTGLYVNKKVEIRPMPGIVLDDNVRFFIWEYVQAGIEKTLNQ